MPGGYVYSHDSAQVTKNKEQPYFVRYIDNRLRRENRDFICCVIGPTGSGKSYSSLAIAEMIDPTFDPKTQVLFDAMEIINLVNANPPKYKAFVVEEVGISLDAAKWQSRMNRAIAHLFQTVRHRNLVFILNVPNVSFLQKSNRILLHSIFETVKIDRMTSRVVIKPFLLSWPAWSDEPYRKYLRVLDGQGNISPLERWHVPKPSEEVLRVYEAKKTAFTTKLYKKLQKEFQDEDLKNSKPVARCKKCFYEWNCRTRMINCCPKCQNKDCEWVVDDSVRDDGDVGVVAPDFVSGVSITPPNV